MGLLSRINNSGSLNGTSKSNSINKNGTGLLARATATTNKTYSSFQEWAKSNGFSHCGIFSMVHGMMVITQAFGLDSQTVANSVSSRDFWKGILSTRAVLNYSKKDNELYNFLQFFSFDLKSSIQHISLLKIKNNSDFSVLMVYNTDSEKEINLTESIENSLKYNSNTKLVLSEFLYMAVQYKKKLYTKNDNEYLKQFLALAFKFISSEDNENETELYSETSLFTIGSNMVNQITGVISSKRTFPILTEIIKAHVHSNKKWERRASIAIIGIRAIACKFCALVTTEPKASRHFSRIHIDLEVSNILISFLSKLLFISIFIFK